MKLPIPNTREGWLAGIFLTITLFGWYYQALYERIYHYYIKQYTYVEIQEFIIPCDKKPENLPEESSGDELVSITPTPSEQDNSSMKENNKELQEQCQDQKWSLKLRIPDFTYFSTPGWIYGELKNENTTQSQKASLVINYSGEIISLLPSMYKEDIFIRRIELGEILPGNTVFWRAKFGSNLIADEKKCNDALISAFWINNKKVDMQNNINLICPKTDVEKALLRSVIESVLLPPWSNTLIPAISLLLCSLLEPNKKEKDEKPMVAKVMVFALETIRTYAISLLVSLGILWILMNFVLGEANTVTTNLSDYTKFFSDLFYFCLILILIYCIFILGSKINWDFLTGRTKELIAKIKNKKLT